MSLIKLTDRKIEEWDKVLLFGANGTGKSRLCNDLNDSLMNLYPDKNIEIMNSKNIHDLVSLTKKTAYVGKASKQKMDNENIKSDIDRYNYLEKYFKLYDAKNPTELKKKSMTFSLKNIKNGRISYYLENIKKQDQLAKKNDLSIDEAIKLDKIFSAEDFIFIESLGETPSIEEIFKAQNSNSNIKKVTNNEFEVILYLRDQIIINEESICPLCGYDYKDFKILTKKVSDYMSSLLVDDNIELINKINSIWNRLKKLDIDYFKYNIYIDEIQSDKDKLFTIIKLRQLMIEIQNSIINDINETISIDENISKKSEIFINNQKFIESEEKRIIDSDEYYKKIKKNFSELVVLPANLNFCVENGILRIKDLFNNKNLNIDETLSDSEIKRLALAVIDAQIEFANIDYLILDDPIDSYDDYFLDTASVYISKMLKRHNISWTITSHLYRPILLFNDNYKDNINNVFYYYDPSYIYNPNSEKPKIFFVDNLKFKFIKQLNNSDILILRDLLAKHKSHKLDERLIIHGGVTTLRSVIKDIKPIFNLSFVKSKVDKSCTKMENRYLHYSSFKVYKMNELILLYQKSFKFIDNSFITNLKNDMNSIKSIEYLMNEKYDDIYADNRLIKEIYYKIVRINLCKYRLEELIYLKLIKLKYPKDVVQDFFKECGLGNKIKIIENYESSIKKNNFFEICNIYNNYATLINDNSHATVRMIPPFLSINIIDVAKFEYFINVERNKL